MRGQRERERGAQIAKWRGRTDGGRKKDRRERGHPARREEGHVTCVAEKLSMERERGEWEGAPRPQLKHTSPACLPACLPAKLAGPVRLSLESGLQLRLEIDADEKLL